MSAYLLMLAEPHLPAEEVQPFPDGWVALVQEAEGWALVPADPDAPMGVVMIHGLEPGPVEGESPGWMPPGTRVGGLVASGTRWDGEDVGLSHPEWEDYRLTLDGEVVVALHQVGEDGVPTVFFVGDLDGDGADDIIVDRSANSAILLVELWLSSEAAADAQLRRVARLRQTHF